MTQHTIASNRDKIVGQMQRISHTQTMTRYERCYKQLTSKVQHLASKVSRRAADLDFITLTNARRIDVLISPTNESTVYWQQFHFVSSVTCASLVGSKIHNVLRIYTTEKIIVFIIVGTGNLTNMARD